MQGAFWDFLELIRIEWENKNQTRTATIVDHLSKLWKHCTKSPNQIKFFTLNFILL